MRRYKIFLLMALALLFPYVFLYGDIVETYDGMILNGKIIEEKKDKFVKLGNHHGIFTIDYKLIKEIHRTERFEDDVKILMDKGKKVDEAAVKTNFQAGLERLEEQEKAEESTIKEKVRPADHALFFSPFFNLNIGKLRTVLPYSFGGSITADVPFYRFQLSEKTASVGIRAEIGYFHSEMAKRRILGARASAGPVLKLPLLAGAFGIDYAISAMIGIGWYSVRGESEKRPGVKWSAAFLTGPVFHIFSAIIFPQVKFDYIYDGRAPVYGIGLALGVGFKF